MTRNTRRNWEPGNDDGDWRMEREAARRERERELSRIGEVAKAENIAQFAAEWTRDITIARRAEWNARVKAGEFTVAGKIDMHRVNDAERRQGWTILSLKTAVEQHGL